MCINGQGFEWLEDPKHLAAIIRNRSKVGAKPQRVPQVARTAGKAIQKRWKSWKRWKERCISKIQASIYVSSGRFDIQFCVKRLSAMMTKPRKLGNLRLARLARYLVGTQKIVLRFDHPEYGDALRIAVDSESNPVNQITVPTNVYCSPGGECCHTSRKCEGLKNVTMDAIRRRRSCMCCVQRNGQ